MTSQKIFELNIADIQPSQLYISQKKLQSVKKWLTEKNGFNYEPIPVKKLNDRIIYVDGHTRAFALWQLGITSLKVEWEPEEWDWEAYQICVDWCLKEKIKTIDNLSGKILPHDEYEKLWHQKCAKMQNELKVQRKEV